MSVSKKSETKREMLFSKSDLKYLVIPLIIEQFLNRVVGMLDTVMVSSVGESAISGVALVDSVNALMMTLFSALASGGAIVASQYLGSKNQKESNSAAQQLLMSTTILSLILCAVSLLFNGPILYLLYGSVEPAVMEHARSYFYITAVSYPFIAIYNAAAALFRGMGNSKVAMKTALLMNIINLVGNAFLIYGVGWGAFGAGLSTTIARGVAAVVMLVLLRNETLPIYVRSYKPKELHLPMIRRILKIGIPNGLENSMFQIGKIMVTSLVATLGTEAITAQAVANSLINIPVLPGFAFGLAMTTVVAQCAGAGEYDQAQEYTSYLMKWSYGLLFVLNIAVLLIIKPLLGFYNLSPETFQIALNIMVIHGIAAMLVWSTSFALPNAIRAAGDVKFTMVVSMFSMFAFRIGFSYLFVYFFGFGIYSVWFGMVIDWTFRSVCFVARWLSGKWRGKAVTHA